MILTPNIQASIQTQMQNGEYYSFARYYFMESLRTANKWNVNFNEKQGCLGREWNPNYLWRKR